MPARVGIARLATLHAFPGIGCDSHGGSGNGPKYSGPKYSGQVRVAGSDPYDLDRDGDGRSMRVVVTSIKSSELSGRSFPAPRSRRIRRSSRTGVPHCAGRERQVILGQIGTDKPQGLENQQPRWTVGVIRCKHVARHKSQAVVDQSSTDRLGDVSPGRCSTNWRSACQGCADSRFAASSASCRK
jgi:hypothetical protein